MDPWFNKNFCDRCHKSLADGFSMSRFNTDTLCYDCLEEEHQHPDYRKAVDAELAALCRNGRSDLIKEFTDYITSSSSYEEALCRVMEYVIVE